MKNAGCLLLLVALAALASCDLLAPKGHLNPADPDYNPAADPANAADAAPVAPTALAAAATEVGKVVLSWMDNSLYEQEFRVERKTGAAGTYAEIATVTGTVGATGQTGAYVDTTVDPGTLYYYRVRAYNAVGSSAYCAETSVTSLAALVPDIGVLQGTVAVPSGTGTYDFGAVYIGSSVHTAFTLENSGTGPLSLTGTPGAIQMSGSDPTLFTVTAAPTSPVAAGASTTFTIAFAPASAGAKSATVVIANDDPDENPYTFAIVGTGSNVPVPEISLKQGLNDIASGAGSYTFASTTVGSTTDVVFTIQNLGTAELVLSGTPAVSLGGTNADQFSVVAQPTSPVGPSPVPSTTFTLRFGPTTGGDKAATVSIANNDSNENPYTFSISGSATYILTAQATTGGSATPASPATVAHGAATTITAMPTSGYYFSGWTVVSGTGASFGDAAAASTTVSLSAESATIQANFAALWMTETVDTSGDVGKYSSIATFFNEVRITYADSSNSKTKMATWPSPAGPWQMATPPSQGTSAFYSSLSPKDANLTRITWQERPGGFSSLWYGEYNKSTSLWTTGPSALATGDGTWFYGYYPSVATNTSGYPSVFSAMAAGGTGQDNVMYYRWTGSSWAAGEPVNISGNDQGSWTALAMNGDNAYAVWYNSLGDLKFRERTTVAWQTVYDVDTSGDVGQYCDVSVTATGGIAHISYYDVSNNSLKHAWGSGSSWSTETVDTNSGQYTSICIPSVGKVAISHYDSTAQRLKFAFYDGASWHIETVDQVGNVGQWSSVAVDASGKIHISYYDAAPANLNLKHAVRVPLTYY